MYFNLLPIFYVHTEVMAEEAAIRQKADEVRAKKEEIEMARGITVEDLTKGLLNYKFTGLTFEQGEKGALRYVYECHILFISILDWGYIILNSGLDLLALNLQNLVRMIHHDHSYSP